MPLVADAEWISKIRETLPELPAAKRARYEKDFGLSAYDADVLASDVAVSAFYDAAVGKAGDAKVLANMVTNDLIAKVHADTVALADCKVKPAMMSELVQAVKGGKISTKGAKEVFIKMWETGEAPLVLIDKLGLSQVSDENQVRDWVKQALAANPQAAADLKGGKDRAIGSIVGAVMKLSKGKANPAVVNALIKEEAAKG